MRVSTSLFLVLLASRCCLGQQDHKAAVVVGGHFAPGGVTEAGINVIEVSFFLLIDLIGHIIQTSRL